MQAVEPAAAELDLDRPELAAAHDPAGRYSLVSGVPCLLVPPAKSKELLALLRESGWHPSHHSRLLLEPTRPQLSHRAYQLSDSAAASLESALAGNSDENLPEAAQRVMQLLSVGEIAWHPFFPLETCILGQEELLLVPPADEDAADDGHFTFVELFAGIGGFRVGLESIPGFSGKCVLASEINPWARAIYGLNFEGEIAGNIQKLDPSDVPAHHILTAGFPCQPYTEKSGERPKGFRDPRAILFWNIIKIVRARRPRAVFLENVTGLLKNDVRRRYESNEEGAWNQLVSAGSAIHAIVPALTRSGYTVSWKLYNAKHLVPQDRERLFIVAIRDDFDAATFVWPDPPSTPHQIRDILQTAEEVDLSQYRLSQTLWDQVTSSEYYQKNPHHRVPDLEGPSNTLRSSYRDGAKLYSQFVPLAVDEEDPEAPPYRFFTPRECARLQGFPDEFVLTHAGLGQTAQIPEKSVYHAIGNAVAPPVIALIGEAILRAIVNK